MRCGDERKKGRKEVRKEGRKHDESGRGTGDVVDAVAAACVRNTYQRTGGSVGLHEVGMFDQGMDDRNAIGAHRTITAQQYHIPDTNTNNNNNNNICVSESE